MLDAVPSERMGSILALCGVVESQPRQMNGGGGEKSPGTC